MRRISLASAGWRARDRQQQVDHQQHNPDVNGRIGEVEYKKVAAEGMQIKIVNDGAMNNAVDRIAEGAADDQSEPDGR